jgi:hypothetical protein
MWPLLAEVPGHFVLYGGTAVALRLGHRVSADFDFFTPEAFQPEQLLECISWLRVAEPRPLQRSANTLTVEVAGPRGPVKLSFFGAIGFGQIRPPDLCAENRRKVASAEDLLALKLATIQQRLEAKDYLDIRALLRAGYSLAHALGHLEALHPLATNAMITLKTLVYFKGGDLETLPEEVKRDLEEAVRSVRDVVPFTGRKTPIGTMT